jgi:hypothetical protein
MMVIKKSITGQHRGFFCVVTLATWRQNKKGFLSLHFQLNFKSFLGLFYVHGYLVDIYYYYYYLQIKGFFLASVLV